MKSEKAAEYRYFEKLASSISQGVMMKPPEFNSFLMLGISYWRYRLKTEDASNGLMDKTMFRNILRYRKALNGGPRAKAMFCLDEAQFQYILADDAQMHNFEREAIIHEAIAKKWIEMGLVFA